MGVFHSKRTAPYQITDLLAGQSGGDIHETIRESLQVLCETISLTTAGIVWEPQGDGSLHSTNGGYRLDIRWPQTGEPPLDIGSPLWLEHSENTRRMGLPEGNGDTPWLTVPLASAGGAAGHLWAIPQPGHRLDDNDRAVVWLAAGQLALACRNAGLRRDLAAQLERQNSLLLRLTQVTEECRRHVARELHDEISQSLAALIFQVDTAQATLPPNNDATAHSLEELRQGLVHLVDEVERLVLELRPALLEQKGLLEALRWYGLQYLQPVDAEFHVSGGKCAPHLSPMMRLTLYRIGQEAIANAARHSDARNVWLEIFCRGNQLNLTIRDDGCGFDTAAALAHQNGMKGIGLQSMQERALLLGGTLTVDSEPDRGTCVHLCVPLDRECPS